MDTVKGCSVIDLFCGVGGLTHGFVKEGIKVLAGIDCDSACKYAYETNNNGAEFIHKGIEEIDILSLKKRFPRPHTKILVGCAPCQPFSPYNKKKSKKDDKWKLLGKFADIVEVMKPQIISMENVPDLMTFDNGRVYNSFVSRLRANGYTVSAYTVYCPNYGIPQSRTRLVLFASQYGTVALEEESHTRDTYRTVRDAIESLPKIEAGETHKDDPVHRASNLTETNLKRIRQSKPGGTWRDWDEELRADCHKKTTGESYDSVYGRMSWDEPAPTMTTQCNGYGNGRFGHPEQDRAISMREAAIFQTFPKEYKFLPPEKKWHTETLARLIGNAVPVDLGRVIARSIKRHIGR